jgi:hypothetical protein
MRRQDWAERLNDYFELKRDVPFEWAKNDCALFAAGAIEAMTDDKVSLPAYTDARSAIELTDAQTLADRVTLILGVPIAPGHAHRGDIVMLEQDGRSIVSVCMGVECASPGKDGLLMSTKPTSGYAWRVG